MAVTLSLFAGAGAQFLDNNGVMLSGGLVYTYAAGTTTPLAAYTSNTGDTALANPIVLDASGRVPTGQIWLTYGQGYKFTVRTSTGVLIGTYDNIPSAALPPLVNDAVSIAYEQGASVDAGDFIIGQTYLITFIGTTNFQSIGAVSNTVGIYFTATGVGSGTGTAEFSRSVQAKLQESVSVKDFGALGDGVTDDTAAFNAAISSGAMRIYVPYTGNEYVITNTISIPRGVIIYGDTLDQPCILCKTAIAGDIVFFSLTGNTQLENLRIYGDSAISGTLISLTGGTYTFTGNIRLRNVRLYQAKIGMFINSIFNARLDGCEFRGCTKGVDASPLTNGGDNGYINAVSFFQCYWTGNTDYDFYANPAVRISVLSFQDCTFDPGPTLAKVYLVKANPCLIQNCYFEGGTTVPAIKGSGATITVETSYFLSTKGIEYDTAQASLVMRQCRVTSTDIINAGNVLHTLRIFDTSLPASGNVIPVGATKYFSNASINGVTYGNLSSTIQVGLGDTCSAIYGFQKTIASTTINANTTTALVSDQLVSGIMAGFKVGTATISNKYYSGLILTVTPATTGNTEYFSVLATNTTGSPITVSSATLNVIIQAMITFTTI